MIYAILFCSVLFGFSIWLIKKHISKLLKGIPSSWLIIALVSKLVAAQAITLVYTYYYQDREHADIYKYYDDAVAIQTESKVLNQSITPIYLGYYKANQSSKAILKNTQHWDTSSAFILNGNRLMTRVHLSLLPFTRGQFWAHQLFFGFLGFWGVCLLLIFFNSFSISKLKSLFLLLFFFPSLLFWTSGGFKETLVLLATASILWSLEKTRSNKLYFIIALSMSLVLVAGRAHTAIIFIPAILGWFFLNEKFKLPPKKWLYFTSGFWVLTAIIFKDKIQKLLNQKLNDFKSLALENNAGSYFEITELHSWTDYLSSPLRGIQNVFLKPLFPPQLNPLSILSAVEQGLLTLAIIFILIRNRKLSEHSKPLFYLCLLLIIPWMTVVGNTVPVLGAIVRYRATILPFILVSLIIFIPKERPQNNL